jgi:hypothetical protein
VAFASQALELSLRWRAGPLAVGHWLGALGFSVLGNVVGGVGIVAFLRLVRVPHRIAQERQRAD